MDFDYSEKVQGLSAELTEFMDEYVYPNEKTYKDQLAASGERWSIPPIMEELKEKAKSAGLWNLFLPDSDLGAGLTNLEYAPLCEIMGRSPIGPEVFNCNAPDTGNMEVLVRYGTPEQQERWLKPLLNGEIRSCFAMTEPDVASSDATNIQSRIERDGDEYVVNGRKWWSTGAPDPRCKISIFMGKTDLEAKRYEQQSMILVPLDAPGVEIERALPVFRLRRRAARSRGGHLQRRARAVENIIWDEGKGFAIAQGRLGPGAHSSLYASDWGRREGVELMCERVKSRVAFGKPLAEQAVIMEWIADQGWR
jgi:acyl-CoA dehydrogenase